MWNLSRQEDVSFAFTVSSDFGASCGLEPLADWSIGVVDTAPSIGSFDATVCMERDTLCLRDSEEDEGR